MAVEESAPHGLKKYTAGTDAFPGRVGYNQMIDKVNLIPSCGIGPLSARPAPSSGLRFWVDEATQRLSVNLGAEWAGIAEIGGVTPTNVASGSAASEGTSTRAARADHTHAIPLATSSVHGAMSSADKALLDGASSVLSPNKLVRASSNGDIAVNPPTAGAHPATKAYVDGQIASRSATGHKHDAGDINTGLLAPACLPDASSTSKGALSAADKALIDAATGSTVANALARRHADGSISFFAVTLSQTVQPYHAARKDYVDSKTWAGSAITSGTIDPARIANATSALDGLMSKSDKSKLDAASSTTAPNTLVQRTPAGNVYGNALFIDGTQGDFANSATRKDYVDSKKWSGSDITSGLIDPARIQKATSSADGLMPAADKAKLDAASTSGANNLVTRNSGGSTRLNSLYLDDTGTPATNMAVRRDYVDAKKWDGSDVTSGVIDPARIANASPTVDGLLSTADKKKLDTSTAYATPNSVMFRNASGQTSTATPTSGDHVANKGYVDGQASNASNLTSGTVNPARIANATSALDGLMSKSDKSKLDSTSSTAGAYTILRASPSGDIAVNPPTAGAHPATKAYVDGQISAAVSPGVWYTLNLRTGWVAMPGFGIPQARLVGDKVEFRGVVDRTTGTPGDIIFSLLSEMRPSAHRLLTVSVMPGSVVSATVTADSGTFYVPAGTTVQRVTLDGLFFHI